MGERRPEDTRSIALCAHGGAGKTSFAEAMLFDNGNISRMGSVESGNTVSDFQTEEQKRNISISTSLLTFERKGKNFYVLDAPGYADFTGEMSAAIRVADTAVILVSAVGGIEVQTSKAWEYADHHNAPVAFVISKMDRENADFEKVLADIKSQFSQNALPVFLPVGSADKFSGVTDVLKSEDSPEKEALIEAAVEMDDALMEKYLEGETIPEAEIEKVLKKAIASRRIMPVFAASATMNIGVKEFMDFVAD
ncbi:MAG: GTP-binding protein, partial [Synergistaceae bacterium]|nr:GTP-binding protein [Synergistaceae bacterium]